MVGLRNRILSEVAPPLASFGVVGPDTRHNDEMELLRDLAELSG